MLCAMDLWLVRNGCCSCPSVLWLGCAVSVLHRVVADGLVCRRSRRTVCQRQVLATQRVSVRAARHANATAVAVPPMVVHATCCPHRAKVLQDILGQAPAVPSRHRGRGDVVGRGGCVR